MQKFKFTSIKPDKVILPEGQKSYPYAIDELIIPSDFTISVSITNGSYSGDTVISQGEVVVITLAANENYSLPEEITVTNATYEYDDSTGKVTVSEPTGNPTITAVCVANAFPIAVSVSDGSYSGDSEIMIGGTASVTLAANTGALLPTSVTVVGADYTYDVATGVVSLSNATGNVTITATCVVIDSTLENNSWETIRRVCEAGDAGDYWALGDEKNVTGGDGYTRPVKLVHMGDIYNGKKAVFQYWYRSEGNRKYDRESSNAVADADIFPMLNVGGHIYADMMGDELATQIGFSGDTTVQVASSGTDATLTTLTGPLFLPAEKELTATITYSVPEEFAALTTFGYYAANDTNDARIKHKASDPTGTSGIAWWERSPSFGGVSNACSINSGGALVFNDVGNTNYGAAPCFAF